MKASAVSPRKLDSSQQSGRRIGEQKQQTQGTVIVLDTYEQSSIEIIIGYQFRRNYILTWNKTIDRLEINLEEAVNTDEARAIELCLSSLGLGQTKNYLSILMQHGLETMEFVIGIDDEQDFRTMGIKN